MTFSPGLLLQELSAILPSVPPRIWVAFSGGVDSTVLLHALAENRAALPAPLHAVHVNHNLNPDSAGWAKHCQAACRTLDIPIENFEVIVDAAGGAGIEAAARDARYDVFRELLEADEVLLTAQHQDDQLETFLLQALRGAGPHGLAAMPRAARLGAGWLLRPLLHWSRAALEAAARERGLEWLQDPANADEHFNRNYIRRKVMPLIRQRWPAVAQTVSRSARHCADAAALVDELAAIDLAACSAGDAVLDVPALRRLDGARRRNVLRHWLDWQGLPRPSERKLEHILSDVLEAGPDAEPCVAWADACVRRYRDHLHVERDRPSPRNGRWKGEVFELGTGWGRLRRIDGGKPGLPEGASIEVRFREGGEKLRPVGRTHHHELKKLFQEAGVLPWRRPHVPLIYVDNVLVAVGDLWMNADTVKNAGWCVAWEEKPPLRSE